jgi:EPS-associated MarR family transcriptional regulator
MKSKRTKLQEDTHFRVLRLLQENPEMSQRKLAATVGISVGGMHYVLKALINKGLVKLENFTAAEDRRRYAYVLTPKGLKEKSVITARFLKRKLTEYEALKEEIETLQNEFAEKGKSSAPGNTATPSVPSLTFATGFL